MSTQLVLDALEQAVWTRQRSGAPLDLVVAHTGRGSQDVSIRCTERLAEAGIAASDGSVGDSFDNALAETINGLYDLRACGCRTTSATELIKPRGPWRTPDAVEFASAEWVDWSRPPPLPVLRRHPTRRSRGALLRSTISPAGR
jgi:putative transposase